MIFRIALVSSCTPPTQLQVHYELPGPRCNCGVHTTCMVVGSTLIVPRPAARLSPMPSNAAPHCRRRGGDERQALSDHQAGVGLSGNVQRGVGDNTRAITDNHRLERVGTRLSTLCVIPTQNPQHHENLPSKRYTAWGVLLCMQQQQCTCTTHILSAVLTHPHNTPSIHTGPCR